MFYCTSTRRNIVSIICYLLLGSLKNIEADYILGFKTKGTPYADSSGSVSVKFYGTKSDSGLILVASGMPNAQMKQVTVSVGVDIGYLIGIDIDLDNDDQWALQYVEITDLLNNRFWNASCFCLLSTDPLEGKRLFHLINSQVDPSVRTSTLFSYGQGSKATGVVISQHVMGSYNPMACARLCIKTNACTGVNIMEKLCELLINSNKIETGLEEPGEHLEVISTF